MSRIDRAFARFRKHGDPNDLARVFDATAPSLFRLAWHLTGDRHTAEDLVQSTFVVAIEDAASCGDGRRVLPWLCGILTNRARMRWRRQRLERDNVPVGEVSVGDPSAAVAARELSEVARTRLHALPVPYREVCVLHVEHGLAAADIAQALARPDATVRSQLQRGLDMLRRALPAALASAARATPPACDLAGLRARVLACARAPATPPIGTARLARWRHLAPRFCTAVAIVALAVPGLLLTSPTPREVESVTVEVAPDEPQESASLRGGSLPQAPVERTAVPPPAVVDPLALLLVRAHFADASPAAGVVVRFLPAGPEGDLLERTATTDASGQARFAAPALGPASLIADRGGSVEVNVRGGTTTLADLDVPPGIEVRGRVCDPDERPIVGAGVWLSHRKRDPCGGEIVAYSGGDGGFVLRDVEPGRLLSAWNEALAPAGVREVPASEAGRAEVDLVLDEDAPGHVFGRVLDERGAPVANAKVLLGEPSALVHVGGGVFFALPARLASTDRDGGFVFTGVALAESAVPVRACAPGTALGELEVVPSISAQVTFTLAREAVVAGSVVDRNGEPAWRGEIAVDRPDLRQRRALLPRWARLVSIPFRDGSYELHHLAAGQQMLRAADGDDVAATSLALRAGEREVWNAELREMAIVGLVVDARGEALAGWQVTATTVDGASLEAVTDGKGRFRLGGADCARYTLLVQERRTLVELAGAAVSVADVVPGAAPVQVTVPDAARATARLTARVELPPSTEPRRVRLLLERTAADGRIDRGGENLRVVDGRFRTRLLRPGRYRLRVTTADLGACYLPPIELVADQQLELPAVRFQAPGGIELEVEYDQGVEPMPVLGWRPAAAAPGDLVSAFVVDGRVSLPGVQPGRYWFVTLGACAAGVGVDVQPGAVARAKLFVSGGPPRRFRVAPGAGDLARWSVFDAQDRLVLEMGDPLPAPRATETTRRLAIGAYRVVATDLRGGEVVSSFRVAEGDDPLVLLLPPPRR